MPKLYKFRTCENLVRVCNIIKTSEFYCANWKSLNDPMEGAFDVAYFPITVADSTSSTFEKIHDLKCQRRILSLSAAVDSIYMWAHYANGFTGIAVEVEIPQDDFDLANNQVMALRRDLHAVEYVDRIIKIDRSAAERHEEVVSRVLTQKLSAWAAEREYRYLLQTDKKILPITNVIFGVRTDPTVKEILRKMCAEVGVICSESCIHRPTSTVQYIAPF